MIGGSVYTSRKTFNVCSAASAVAAAADIAAGGAAVAAAALALLDDAPVPFRPHIDPYLQPLNHLISLEMDLPDIFVASPLSS